MIEGSLITPGERVWASGAILAVGVVFARTLALEVRGSSADFLALVMQLPLVVIPGPPFLTSFRHERMCAETLEVTAAPRLAPFIMRSTRPVAEGHRL